MCLWSAAGIESEHDNRDFLEIDTKLLNLLSGSGLVVAEVEEDFRLFLFLSVELVFFRDKFLL